MLIRRDVHWVRLSNYSIAEMTFRRGRRTKTHICVQMREVAMRHLSLADRNVTKGFYITNRSLWLKTRCVMCWTVKHTCVNERLCAHRFIFACMGTVPVCECVCVCEVWSGCLMYGCVWVYDIACFFFFSPSFELNECDMLSHRCVCTWVHTADVLQLFCFEAWINWVTQHQRQILWPWVHCKLTPWPRTHSVLRSQTLDNGKQSNVYPLTLKRGVVLRL